MSGRFTDLDAGCLTQAKALAPLFKPFSGQEDADIIKERVTGIFDRIGYVHGHGRIVVFTFEFLPSKFKHARTGKGGVGVDHTLLKRCDRAEHLEGRARCIQAAYRAVVQDIARVGLQFIVIAVIILQIIGRIRSHDQHLARIRVKRNRCSAAFIPGKVICQRILRYLLQLQVDRGDHVVTRLRRIGLRLIFKHRAAAQIGFHRCEPAVPCRYDSSASSRPDLPMVSFML